MIQDTTFTARGDVDPRVAELTELFNTEGYRFAIGIRATIDFTLWLEDRGYYVNYQTGVAVALVDEKGMEDVFEPTRSGKAVNHLLSPVTDDEVEQTINGLFSATDDGACAPAGTLHSMILEADRDERWYEAEADDYEDDMADRDFWASGRW